MQNGNFASVRSRFIELLDEPNAKWKCTKLALADAERLGRTEEQMIELVLDLLRSGEPLHEVRLGEPPGSAGLAYSMTGVDGQGLYIKLGEDWDRVLIFSFHVSKHFRGTK